MVVGAKNYYRAQTNDLSQVVFQPTSVYDQAKYNLVGQYFQWGSQ